MLAHPSWAEEVEAAGQDWVHLTNNSFHSRLQEFKAFEQNNLFQEFSSSSSKKEENKNSPKPS